MKFDAAMLVQDVIQSHPETAHVFSRFREAEDAGITLGRLADRGGVKIDGLLGDLKQAVEDELASRDRDWSRSGTRELIDYILRRHHPFARYELRRMQNLFETLLDVSDNDAGCNLLSLYENYRKFVTEVREHFAIEERTLFPWLKARAEGKTNDLADVEADGYRHMEQEHENAKSFFAQCRQLTRNYARSATTPKPILRLFEAFIRLEADFARHIELENDFLWPGAVAVAEVSLASHACPMTKLPCPQGDPTRCKEFWNCVHSVLSKMESTKEYFDSDTPPAQNSQG